jgi:hypothetical protein
MHHEGPDCCGNCAFNRAVQEMAHPHPEHRERFWQLSYCTLRKVRVTAPYWSCCPNFHYGNQPVGKPCGETPTAWITISGLYEGYVRIPWDDDNEPQVAVPAECCICGRQTDEGIEIRHGDQTYGFCTNRHYMQWWQTLHHAPELDPDTYQTPEERYGEPAH